ncbi:heat shock 70 kDa protein 12A-like [Mya arenaria]|uniref:heat shock 70 kDa protein 12A-like n=1 Tax=Mya arenaria TaxID=6604 RepID=UPI0022E5E047|nr:heat shock 70 kDa protein 12A-like [Mya arenaria]XP_052793771.1 heat shock 70 kDa protein 12A-like [Mya arenaria]XP_052793772.1 heat shock 70 kDa protein 12A-like [Mya arenaria]XP_052793773.1 heat shock 70 kDa protein 12A-like [Mya arenaria]XP_052793774.1 heat shock 70 kDa protein 12A-like [Mya arenaria]
MTAALPVLATAVQERLQVAAIDFGTTYSGYAFSFRAEFLENPLKILTNKWEARGGSALVSMKAPSCVLFTPERKFHSFGYEAEKEYSRLAMEDEHKHWFFFRRFKMLLYKSKKLKRTAMLDDELGKKMSAMDVFAACIRYLREHLMFLCQEKSGARFLERDVHWVLTVPAIWDDSAKQFMREAAVEAGIKSEHLSLALEPEAASLFCRYLPVSKVCGADGTTAIQNFAPGKRYLVLDAGGGTVDITVHETLSDGTVKEVYKANGGPWGGTTVDAAFFKFLEKITGTNVMEIFKRDYKDDELDLMRDFEIKKKTIESSMDPSLRFVFRMPVAIHDVFKTCNGTDFRQSLMMQQDLKDNVTFSGDKLRVKPEHAQNIFKETCDHIVEHLKDIFAKPAVQGTETILMVGGFSESKMLQHSIGSNFPNKRIIIPEDAGLAVLKGAVIFGHNPTAIVSRVAKFTYGVKVYRNFDPSIHPLSRKVILDGEERCQGCFDKHVEMNQDVQAGMAFEEKVYYPPSRHSKNAAVKIFTSKNKHPKYTNDHGCEFLGSLVVELPEGGKRDKKISVKMIYGMTELGLEATKLKTGETLNVSFNFLG